MNFIQVSRNIIKSYRLKTTAIKIGEMSTINYVLNTMCT